VNGCRTHHRLVARTNGSAGAGAVALRSDRVTRAVLLAAVSAAAACGSSTRLVDDGPLARVGAVELAVVGAAAALPPPGDPRWAPLEEGASLQRNAVYWLRAPVVVLAPPDPARPLGVAVSLLASYELYWDGAAIAASGRVGASRADEQPGRIDRTFVLPPAAVGPHLLTLRLSNFHYDGNLSNSFYRLGMGPYGELVTGALRARFPPLLALGWLVVAAVLFLLVYFAQGRRPSALLFAAICALVAAALLGQSWRWLFGYTYDHHLTRLWLVTVATCGASLLIPIAFAHELAVRRKRAVAAVTLVAITAALVVPDAYNPRASLMFALACTIALVLAVAAARRRRRGAWPAIAGLAACLAPLALARGRYHDAGFFAGFSVLLVALLSNVGMRILDERRAAARAALRSTRLELELVKRGIQPHFLMNALTSILESIEQEPARAARFVEALAGELQLLSRVSMHQLIPIELELALCRAHVALMSERLEIALALRCSGIDPSELVPPALFHTLIENAITHGRFAATGAELALEAHRTGSLRRYRLVSPELDPAPAGPDGTGLRYVRARLDESHGDRWRLRGGPTPGGWETVIEIEDA
jgi:hypothetical protein